MAGVMYLGNQMVSPAIIQGGEENPLFPIKDGVITKDVSNGINAVGVKEIGDSGLYSAFSVYDYSSSEADLGHYVTGTVSFPDLEKIGNLGMKSTFYGQYNIKKVELPKLKEIGLRGLAGAFNSDSVLEELEINLDSLENIGSYGLRGAFSHRSLNYLLFPSLKAENFTNESDDQFSGMLSYVSNCTVYFRSDMQQVIGSWSVVTSGLYGTNTTVIFWIPTKIKVNLAQENAVILANDKVFNNVIFGVGETVKYVVTDDSLNKNYLGTESGCVEDGQERAVSVDLNSLSYNKITVTTGVTRKTDVSASWEGIELPLVDEGSGVYSIYVNETVGEKIIFSIRKATNHGAGNLTITTSGSNIDETINVHIYTKFTRPNLTSNGEIGGSSFAVTATNNEADAYKAVDSSTSTYWEGPSMSEYLIYNPNPLCIYAFTIRYTTSSYKPTYISVKIGDGDWVSYSAPSSGSTLILIDREDSSSFNRDVAKEYRLRFEGRTTRVTDIAFMANEDLNDN